MSASRVCALLIVVPAAVAATAASAVAHPGPHNTMSFTELAAHLASGWHLAMLLGAGVVATVVALVAASRARPARAARNRRSDK
jgi:hypothetical protein